MLMLQIKPPLDDRFIEKADACVNYVDNEKGAFQANLKTFVLMLLLVMLVVLKLGSIALVFNINHLKCKPTSLQLQSTK